MAFDEQLANRVREALAEKNIRYEEKQMFGGLCFMINEKMCVGIDAARLMVRLDPAVYDEALSKPGCVPMDFTGKPMRGYVFAEPEGIATPEKLRLWIDLAIEFNPRAKASRNKSS